MKNTLKKIWRSEYRFDDTWTLVMSGIPSRGMKFTSRKVEQKISGTFDVQGVLKFGFLTNKVGLDPKDGGILQVYPNGELTVRSNCSILKGVTIGEGSVIGTRSVVTRNIPPRSLAVGSPAKVIKTNVNWS